MTVPAALRKRLRLLFSLIDAKRERHPPRIFSLSPLFVPLNGVGSPGGLAFPLFTQDNDACVRIHRQARRKGADMSCGDCLVSPNQSASEWNYDVSSRNVGCAQKILKKDSKQNSLKVRGGRTNTMAKPDCTDATMFLNSFPSSCNVLKM